MSPEEYKITLKLSDTGKLVTSFDVIGFQIEDDVIKFIIACTTKGSTAVLLFKGEICKEKVGLDRIIEAQFVRTYEVYEKSLMDRLKIWRSNATQILSLRYLFDNIVSLVMSNSEVLIYDLNARMVICSQEFSFDVNTCTQFQSQILTLDTVPRQECICGYFFQNTLKKKQHLFFAKFSAPLEDRQQFYQEASRNPVHFAQFFEQKFKDLKLTGFKFF